MSQKPALKPSWNDRPDVGPSWEDVDEPGFAAATLTYHLRIRFDCDIDWSDLRDAISTKYQEGDDGLFHAHGRTIEFRRCALILRVSGTSEDLPRPDDKLQTIIIAIAADQLASHIKSVGTERFTDTPFEEAGEKARNPADGLFYLRWLVRVTMSLRVVDFDYYTPRLMGGDAANPEIQISIEGPEAGSMGVRHNWMPVTKHVPPGSYRLQATGAVFTLPEYKWTLKEYAWELVFVSKPIDIEGNAGDLIELRLGVSEEHRQLPAAHKAFYDQRGKTDLEPPPAPLEVIDIAVIAQRAG